MLYPYIKKYQLNSFSVNHLFLLFSCLSSDCLELNIWKPQIYNLSILHHLKQWRKSSLNKIVLNLTSERLPLAKKKVFSCPAELGGLSKRYPTMKLLKLR